MAAPTPVYSETYYTQDDYMIIVASRAQPAIAVVDQGVYSHTQTLDNMGAVTARTVQAWLMLARQVDGALDIQQFPKESPEQFVLGENKGDPGNPLVTVTGELKRGGKITYQSNQTLNAASVAVHGHNAGIKSIADDEPMTRIPDYRTKKVREEMQRGTQRRSQQPDQQPSNGEEPPRSESGTVELGDFDYKVAKQYPGERVGFNVTRIVKGFNQYDGDAEWQLYGTYNGGPSKYPAISFREGKPTRNDIRNDSTWKAIEDMRAYLRDLTAQDKEVTGNWRAVAYVNQKGDKTYINLNKLEPVNSEAQPESRQEDIPF